MLKTIKDDNFDHTIRERITVFYGVHQPVMDSLYELVWTGGIDLGHLEYTGEINDVQDLIYMETTESESYLATMEELYNNKDVCVFMHPEYDMFEYEIEQFVKELDNTFKQIFIYTKSNFLVHCLKQQPVDYIIFA